jgi:hypothetical protein
MTVCMLNATTMLRPLRYGRIHQETVDRGFEDLQSIMYCGSISKSVSTYSIKTKTDTQIKATKHLLTTASWLESVANVLEEYRKILCNNQTSRHLILKRSQVMRYIIPLLWHAANSMKDISTTLASIFSVSYAQNRTENTRKIEVVD